MKVWIVIEGFNYEGYAEPRGVYQSLELAEAAADRLRYKRFPADSVEVLEYEIDKDGGPVT